MTAPVTTSGIWQGIGASRGSGTVTPQELSRRAHAKIGEKIDFSRSHHVPIMILRQQARKIVELLLDMDWPLGSRDEKNKLTEDILAESIGLSPLEELFRENRWREIMILGPECVIARQSEGWQQMKVKFRDATQVRRLLGKIVETGEGVTNTAPFAGGFDVRMQNGYRVIGLTPPDNAGVSPMVLFSREEKIAQDVTQSVMMSKLSGTISNPTQSVMMSKLSGTTSMPSRNGSSVALKAGQMMRATPSSANTATTRAEPDPFAKIKQKVSEKIIDACARSGVYNLSAISSEDLGAGINGHITEVAAAERITIEPAVRERLVREIMQSMYGG